MGKIENGGKPAGSGMAEVAVSTLTYSARFTSAVVKEFSSQVGKIELDPYQKQLATHLFISINKALGDLEAKRSKEGKDNRAPIVWANVNMEKLAIDAVHRIELGLDALIPNHIHVIPYFNGKHNKYDLSLEVGYAGKDYFKREMALTKPKDIIYELVRKNDRFKPLMKSAKNPVESYEFDIENPFDRGPVVGGFGYIMYDDTTKNKLVIVDMQALEKARKAAKTQTFWSAHPDEMMYVVLVRKTTKYLQVDPKKVNRSYMVVEADDNSDEIDREANTELLDIDAAKAIDGEFKELPKKAIEQQKEPKGTGSGGKMPTSSDTPPPAAANGTVYLRCPAKLN